MKKPVYLDYNATSPVRPEAIARMQEALAMPSNPSSAHRFGREAKKHLEDARQTVAAAVSAWPDEVIFCGSGTEANMMALRARDVIVSAIEHSSILKSLPLEGGGGRAQRVGGGDGLSMGRHPLPNPPPSRGREYIIPVTSDGIVDFMALDNMLAKYKPQLISVMLANNETGVIQPIAAVAELCKRYGILLHCDAVQGMGKIPVDFGALGVDMLTISGHKCGGPVGAAALIVRRGVEFAPLFVGGGQEKGRRAGTENVAAIAGFAKALELIDFGQMKQLRGWLDGMEQEISSPIRGEGIIFGRSVLRLPNTSCITMPHVSNEVQLMDFDLKGFAVSAGSACSSGRIEASHVLSAMGVPKEIAECAIRISAGWDTKQSDISAFTDAWKSTCERLAIKA